MAFPRRALVVEDDALTRALIGSLLVVARFDVRGCASAREAMEVFESFDPDVLVVDIQLQEQPNGAQLASAIAMRAPHIGIVMVSHYPGPSAAGMRNSLPPGAAFVNKSEVETSAVLLDAIESVLDDARPPTVRRASPDSDLAGLTAVQLEVLEMIAIGCSNAEIARRRGVAKRTAEESVQRVYAALGIGETGERNARVEATRLYVKAFGMPEDRGE